MLDAAVDNPPRGERGERRHRSLVERISVAGSIAPNAFFELNHAGFFGAVGAMVNFLLVLIAFKVDEG